MPVLFCRTYLNDALSRHTLRLSEEAGLSQRKKHLRLGAMWTIYTHSYQASKFVRMYVSKCVNVKSVAHDKIPKDSV